MGLRAEHTPWAVDQGGRAEPRATLSVAEIIAAFEKLDPMIDALNGLKNKFVSLGWSKDNAEQVVVALIAVGAKSPDQ